ncbi:Thiol:disulfide interchange protein DsbG, putative (modular protein) [Acidithiobacillus ferrivorans]|uniref:Thiol:disulfide interchange protein DsbG, putative (Modular protein) n=1 Tax=Acidithiobacillus ferrivorans TaxID=160808 RepID=A0A060UP64_9PROT|nr:thioredoxin fold domain-containing protein [Acidithiobacillus ferrivorans]CDQ10046.1 Thiol:disulfide interchange protein DsbG,putative (modular protein) [Acidithiobacillus ferrivorans]SMH64726.1 Thiol:disulfide interchange protein DsbG, putative (modular protein) [Acidithiobacillus ferrivorans]
MVAKRSFVVGIMVGVLAVFTGVNSWAGAPDVTVSGTKANVNRFEAKTLVQSISHGKMHLVKVFSGPESNIVGVIAKAPTGQKVLAWMVDGKYMAIGALIGADGKNLSLLSAAENGLMAKPLPANITAARALTAQGFTVGHAGPLMVVFMDPNCIYCNKFWDAAQADILAGKLRLKVIPVGFLKPTSLAKATTILQSADPATAWVHNERRFQKNIEEGGEKPALHLDPKALVDVRANTALLGSTGEMVTPTLVYCQHGHKTPLVLHGITPDFLNGLGAVVDLSPSGKCLG